MNIILCHKTADFDALGAAVGLTHLHPGSRLVLAGGCHPTVKQFLALHRDEFAIIERRSVNPEQIHSIYIVDVQTRSRLGKTAQWLDLPHLSEIIIYDHHCDIQTDIPATETHIEAVGATTTLITEKLQTLKKNTPILTPAAATIMALGIHADTGSLTFDHTTPRDAKALAWLMQQGASLPVIGEYIEPALSPQLQELLKTALENLQRSTVRNYQIGSILLKTDEYVPGLSSLASSLIDLTEIDALLLAHTHSLKNTTEKSLNIIGRSRIPETNLNQLFQPLGGGGHYRAAAVSCRDSNPEATLAKLLEQLKNQIPQPTTARNLMSSPVRTIPPETSIAEAHRILLRYGHSGLCTVDSSGKLVGIISRRDIDIALHHGFSHAPVKGYMTPQLKTISPETTLSKIEELMIAYDIGRLPVLENNFLVGIVTRTDVLRELHQQQRPQSQQLGCIPGETCKSIAELLQQRLAPQLWQLLTCVTEEAEKRGWELYLIGGGVRDLLLSKSDETLLLTDIDLVVDGCHSDQRKAEGRGQKAEGNNKAEGREQKAEGKEFDAEAISKRKAKGTEQKFPEENLPPSASYLLPSHSESPSEENLLPSEKAPAVELAKALQKIYPTARLEVHGQFQTAALLWHNDLVLDSLWIDIATARTEFYPYPAANPEVEASSIRQDLYRRDFTINALAVRLTKPGVGELLDYFGGLSDLRSQQIRVLHANSFIEDPTRIYRGVRFAVRLGFEIESKTEEYIRYAINSGVYEREVVGKGGKNRRAPALETRLKSELKYILQAHYWKPALKLLGSLGALRCIHHTLELDRKLWQQVCLLDRCLQRLDSEKNLSHWQMRLEVLIISLESEYRGLVGNNLQLPLDSIKRLEELESAKVKVMKNLPKCQTSSQVVWLLREYDLPMLMLIIVQCDRWMRHRVWQYLTQWMNVKPILNGNDLKIMGYQPGRQFKLILDDILAATLDGKISDRSEAEEFLAKYYPRGRE
ncbi:CBS domain-containing protein [Okeania sp.]|uniref:CBS domain-containing protein n=1 Tax=Okeania sp. TaxID=3100323 RepID=UPI002B4ABA48|nr:CBS domain-containing protein [Okeania sp.]MEB3340350.1 CBS domain-containing protein [Okeania sp.]